MRRVAPFEWWHAQVFGVVRASDDVTGLTEFTDGRVSAIGVVYVQESRIWAALAGTPRPLHFRWARRLFHELAAHGVTQIWATPDHRNPKAPRWLSALGFSDQGNGEWLCELSAPGAVDGGVVCQDGDAGAACGVNGTERLQPNEAGL